MCGRFSQDPRAQASLDLLHTLGAAAKDTATAKTRYNLAPTQAATVVVRAAEAPLVRAVPLPFGMRRGDAGQVINARAETLTERPMFRGLLRWHRCLVLADGFYEWRKEPGGKKQPFFFRRADGAPFCLAALRARDPKPSTRDAKKGDDAPAAAHAQAPRGFVVVTCAANPVVQDVHPRMPVMLSTQAAQHWLSWDTQVEDALDLLVPYAAAMQAYPVTTAVNSPRHDAKDCTQPLAEGG